jgi:hypothetical protein
MELLEVDASSICFVNGLLNFTWGILLRPRKFPAHVVSERRDPVWCFHFLLFDRDQWFDEVRNTFSSPIRKRNNVTMSGKYR